MSASVSRGISPSATATPSALAPRETPIDLSVSRVATVSRRVSASVMRCAVSSGHLICTKWTSAGSMMPASAIAARTPSATWSTCARRPICSGLSAGVCARPMASAGPFPEPSWVGSWARSNTVQCGAIAPSVPPDITRQTSFARAPRCFSSSSVSARVAKPRVKSLTLPLPSVLPRIATMPFGSMRPSPIAAAMPLTSLGAAAETRWTFAIGMSAARRFEVIAHDALQIR
jgi:hypothetical protein